MNLEPSKIERMTSKGKETVERLPYDTDTIPSVATLGKLHRPRCEYLVCLLEFLVAHHREMASLCGEIHLLGQPPVALRPILPRYPVHIEYGVALTPELTHPVVGCSSPRLLGLGIASCLRMAHIAFVIPPPCALPERDIV